MTSKTCNGITAFSQPEQPVAQSLRIIDQWPLMLNDFPEDNQSLLKKFLILTRKTAFSGEKCFAKKKEKLTLSGLKKSIRPSMTLSNSPSQTLFSSSNAPLSSSSSSTIDSGRTGCELQKSAIFWRFLSVGAPDSRASISGNMADEGDGVRDLRGEAFSSTGNKSIMAPQLMIVYYNAGKERQTHTPAFSPTNSSHVVSPSASASSEESLPLVLESLSMLEYEYHHCF